MSHHRTCAALRFNYLLFWAILFLPLARAHDTVVYDTVPGFSIGGAGNITGPSTLLATVTVRLRPKNLEVDLTMADAAAYGQLAGDPYQPPATTPPTAANPGPAGFSDQHFKQDQALLAQRGGTLLTLTSNGAPFEPLADTVEITSSQDIVFHLIYPPTPSGPVHLQTNFLDPKYPDKKVLVTVMDHAGNTSMLWSMNASIPSVDIETTAPVAPAAVAPPHRWLGVVAGVAASLAVLWLMFKLRQSPAKD